MCYTKPGPRCAAHLRVELEAALLDFEVALNGEIPKEVLTPQGMTSNPKYKCFKEPSLSEIGDFMMEWHNGTPTLGSAKIDEKRKAMMESATNYFSTPEGLEKLYNSAYNTTKSSDNGVHFEGAETINLLALKRENQIVDYLADKITKGQQVTESGFIAGISKVYNIDMLVHYVRSAEQFSPAALNTLVCHKALTPSHADFIATRGDPTLFLAVVTKGKTSHNGESFGARKMGCNEAMELAISEKASDNSKLAMMRPDVSRGAHDDSELQKRVRSTDYLDKVKTAAGIELVHHLADDKGKVALTKYLSTAKISSDELKKLAQKSEHSSIIQGLAADTNLPDSVRTILESRENYFSI